MMWNLTGVVLLSLSLTAAEKTVKLDSLPAAVKQTVQQESKGAEIKKITAEKEKGKTVYEVETMVAGKSRDFVVDSTGALVNVEQEVDIQSIPAPARAAIEKRAAGGKITRVEAVTEGQHVSYEAAIVIRGKKSEFSVGPDGSPKK